MKTFNKHHFVLDFLNNNLEHKFKQNLNVSIGKLSHSLRVQFKLILLLVYPSSRRDNKWSNISSISRDIRSKEDDLRLRFGFLIFALRSMLALNQATGMTKISRGGGYFRKFFGQDGGYFTGNFEF